MTNIRKHLPEIRACSEGFDKYNNKAIDWLIASWSEKEEEKEFCMIMHKKYKKKAFEFIHKMKKYE